MKNNAVAATAMEAVVFKIGVIDWRREGLGKLGFEEEDDEALMVRNLSGDGENGTALMEFGGNGRF